MNPSQIVLLFILSLTAISIRLRPYNFQFIPKPFYIPHPDKAYRGGEDAHYVSSRMIVVADGVSGWSQKGIDPSGYSRFFCRAAANYLHENEQLYLSDPLQIIKRAQIENLNLGSCTAVVLTVYQNSLNYCYMGDSSFLLIRRYGNQYMIIHRSIQQQHSFNYPYQLSMNINYKGINVKSQNSQNSICGSVRLSPSDIVVAGSDGLFDNVGDEKILQLVRRADLAELGLEGVTQDLALLAIARGKDKKFNSPFAIKAKKNKLNFMGGKLDDTTVIVAKIHQLNRIIVTY